MLDPDDPTQVRNQPALSTSSGREWLVIGGITAVICIVVLVFQVSAGAFLALIGAALVVVIYAAMVVVKETVKRPRRRLGILAALLLTMTLVTMAALLLIVFTSVP
jgi:hypothetical protein